MFHSHWRAIPNKKVIDVDALYSIEEMLVLQICLNLSDFVKEVAIISY